MLEGAATTCLFCGRGSPSLSTRSLCPRCERQLTPGGDPGLRKRRRQEKKFERLIVKSRRRS